MSLIKNIRTIVVQSTKAMENGVDLLAHIADQAAKSTTTMVAQNRLKDLETQLRHSLDDGAPYTSLLEMHNQLINLYKEHRTDLLASENAELQRRYADLLWEIEGVESQELERRVLYLRAAIGSTQYELPVRKIKALEDLRSTVKRLSTLRRQQGSADARLLIDEIIRLDAEITSLQEQRQQIFHEDYLSGATLFKYRKFDGLLDGSVEMWYPNGVQAFLYVYSTGNFQSAKCWNVDSSLSFEISANASGLDLRALVPNGQVVLASGIKDGIAKVSVSMWDGYRVREAEVPVVARPTLGFIFPILFKPGFWLRLFKASRDKEIQNRFREMAHSSQRLEQGVELISIFGDLSNNDKSYEEIMNPHMTHFIVPNRLFKKESNKFSSENVLTLAHDVQTVANR